MACDSCECWYHFDCDEGIKEADSNIRIENAEYICLSCKELNSEELAKSLIEMEENMRDEVDEVDSQPLVTNDIGSLNTHPNNKELNIVQTCQMLVLLVMRRLL